MRQAFIILVALLIASFSLAASISKSFKVIIDRTPPIVSCTGDTQLTNGGHGNLTEGLPDKDFQVIATVSDPGDAHAPVVAVGYKTDSGTEDYLGA